MDIKNPSNDYRAVALWSWNDLLVNEELQRKIKDFADKGFGGFFMHPRVGILTEYASEEWFDIIRFCALEAEKNGIKAWMYDEDRWPSGYGAGEVSKIEEFRTRALILLKDGQTEPSDIPFAEYEQGGIRYVIAKRVAKTGDPWFNGMCFADLMNKDAIRRFLDCTHEKYKKYCGDMFGNLLPGIFTDEPAYIMYNDYKMPALPWSEKLPAFFLEKNRYDITEHLPSLFFRTGDYRKIRYDFFNTAADLLTESFSKQYYEWCEENNLMLTGHFMAEDSLTYQTSWVGNIMPNYEYMHIPGIDKLGRRINQNITVKQLTSVCDQLDKKRAFSEVYGCIGQQCSFKERKWIADWQACLGINLVDPHLSLYSMRGERKRDFPSDISEHNPWWQDEKQFADYIARISQIAATGKRRLNTLVIHTIGSCWCEFDTVSKVDGPFDAPFSELTDKLIENNLDFHFGDEKLLEKYAVIENGKLKMGSFVYDNIILPPAATLRSSTYKLLQEIIKAKKSNVIAVYPYPDRLDGSLTELDIINGALKIDSVDSAVSELLKLSPERIRTTDLRTGKNAEKIYCSIRDDKDETVIFFTNTNPNREVKAEIEISDRRPAYLMDLASGEYYLLPCKRDGEKIVMNPKMSPAGSFAVLLTEKETGASKYNLYTATGTSFAETPAIKSRGYGYKTSLDAPNVMPINNVTFYLDGKLIGENVPAASLWKDYFYAAEDGTPFSAEYSFDIEQMPGGELFAAVECAQNLDEITLNGMTLTPLKKKGEPAVYDEKVNYIDQNFIKVPLSSVKTGRNILKLSGKKINNTNGMGGHRRVKDSKNYHCTELEAVYIIGDFTVNDIDKTTFSIGTGELSYENISESGAPFYAGAVTVTAEIYSDSKKDGYLHLNSPACSAATVYVNGKDAGTRYMKPFIYDVSDYLKEGVNEITVKMTNTLFNLMGPNWIEDIENRRYICPDLFYNIDLYTEELKILPYGLKSIEIMEKENN